MLMAQNKNREMAEPHGEDTTRTLYPHFERRRTSSGGKLIKDCMVVRELIGDENIKEEALPFYDSTNYGTIAVLCGKLWSEKFLLHRRYWHCVVVASVTQNLLLVHYLLLGLRWDVGLSGWRGD